jgi:hypothetical protein
MRLILTTLIVAVSIGYLGGGRLVGLAGLELRWAWLALAGVALQFVPWNGLPGVATLLLSFAALITFGLANVRRPGFALIVIGLALNLTVIAVNRGMPVTRDALVSSGQASTLASLVADGGNKHHLAGATDELVVLGDWIGVGSPIRQAISVGDLFVNIGAGWFIVIAMRGARRTERTEEPAIGSAG